MIWLETPSNPLLKVTDIAAIVEITKTFRSDILMVVDNTFMSPYFQVCFYQTFFWTNGSELGCDKLSMLTLS